MSTITSNELDGCSFSDLLCGEDSDTVFSVENSSPLSEFDSAGCAAAADEYEEAEAEESIAGFIEDEEYFFPGFKYSARFRSDESPSESSLDASSRAYSISWILKVRAFYGFQALTAYLAVNYLDRFLCSHQLPQTKGWPLQLLSVACLSLAAKMEEPLVPSLVDLQIEGTKHNFEPKTIQRMELLVLRILEWRLSSVTPFNFISYFAYKVDATGTFTGFLISRASEIILSNLQDTSLLEYRSSSIAAAAVLCAGTEIPNQSMVVSPEHAETWCDGLSKDKVINCYRRMQQYLVGRKDIRPSKALPQFRVLTRTRACRVRSSSSFDYDPSSSSPYSTSSSSSSSTLSSSSSIASSFLINKRRRLNTSWSWVNVDDDWEKESSGQ